MPKETRTIFFEWIKTGVIFTMLGFLCWASAHAAVLENRVQMLDNAVFGRDGEKTFSDRLTAIETKLDDVQETVHKR